MTLDAERKKLANALSPLGLGGWQYYPTLGSTNDLALKLARKGAPDWTLVVADTQTAGRGRADRTWETKLGGLAFSLVLRPSPQEVTYLTRFSALAGLALVHALAGLGLQAQVKWPNDVLLVGKKVAGVLVESEWKGGILTGLILGMGVNVTRSSVPDRGSLRYPATSVEAVSGQPVDRWALLARILKAMQDLRSSLPTESFIREWNQHLAFRDEAIHFSTPDGKVIKGRLRGVTSLGGITVEIPEDGRRDFIAGEIVMG